MAQPRCLPTSRIEDALRARAQSMSGHAAAGSEWFGLVDEHDGDVILDGVHQSAGVAHEAFGRRAVFQLTLAFRADQNLKQFRSETHETSFVIEGNPNLVSATGSLRQCGRAFTHRSRYTGAWTSSSRRLRARWPIALSVRPPRPITMPFWDSRSTNRLTRMYMGRSFSRNSSTSADSA